jgi:hypothetical protein
VSRVSVNLRGFQNPGIVGVLLKKGLLRGVFFKILTRKRRNLKKMKKNRNFGLKGKDPVKKNALCGRKRLKNGQVGLQFSPPRVFPTGLGHIFDHYFHKKYP